MRVMMTRNVLLITTARSFFSGLSSLRLRLNGEPSPPLSRTLEFLQNLVACVLDGSDECPDAEAIRVRTLRMKTFTIENGTNDITVYASAIEAEATANCERLTSEDELATLVAVWPPARLVEIWNSLPGKTPVKKFKDRATGVSRIWRAIQSLGEVPAAVESEPVAEDVAPAAELPEATPVSADPTGKTAPPYAVVPKGSDDAIATPVARQAPDVAPKRASAKKGATRARKRPQRRRSRWRRPPPRAKAARAAR
jgi:hypothetical protein